MQVARKRRYHHGDLREALMRAAFLLARGGGPDAVTLRAVAAKAGVSEAAPYHHFADKRALLAGAAGLGFELFDRRVRAALARVPAADPTGRLVAFAGAYVAFALDEPGAFRLMFGAHVEDHDLASVPEALEAGRRVKRTARDLARAHSPTEAETLFQMTWAIAHGWATLVIEKELDPRGAEAPGAKDAIAHAERAVRAVAATMRPSG